MVSVASACGSSEGSNDAALIPDGPVDSAGDARVDGPIDAPIDSPVDAPGCGTDASAPPADMVTIAAGSFWMGCRTNPPATAATDPDCDRPEPGPGADVTAFNGTANEKPFHQVTLAGYTIDETEVTQAQYLACVQAGVCSQPQCDPPPTDWDPCTRGPYPVVCVTRAQAGAYCTWAGKRLPTEAEWERAARWDATTQTARIFPWGDDAPTSDRANYFTDLGGGCGSVLVPVKSKPLGATPGPNPIYEMAGNAVEIVSDWYDPAYYVQPGAADNPTGPGRDPSNPEYVGRGGGFCSKPHFLRTSDRDPYDEGDAGQRIGFRCAQSTH